MLFLFLFFSLSVLYLFSFLLPRNHMLLKVFSLFILHITIEGDFRKILQAIKLSDAMLPRPRKNNYFTNRNILNCRLYYFSKEFYDYRFCMLYACYIICLFEIFTSQALFLKLRIIVYLKSPRSV